MSKDAVLVGCGAMAAGWLKALSDPAIAGRVGIVGLVDTNLAAAVKLSADFGLRETNIVDNLAAVLEAHGADIVFDVATPDARHDIVETALRHRCHVEAGR